MPITLNGTTGEVFPSWTTAGRPSSPVAGQTGYNTTLNTLERYNGTTWGPVVTTADTGTVSQTMLASNVAGNGPAFIAYPSANTTLTTGYTFYLVSVNTIVKNDGSCFNNTGSTTTLNGLSVPAYAFCPNIAGYYYVVHAASLVDASSNMYSSVYKNGVVYALSAPGGIVSGSAYNTGANGSCLVYLNGTGDYIQMYYSANASSKAALGGSSTNAFFHASMIRSA